MRPPQLTSVQVKVNVGHGEGASGITSLIKAVLALERETIPPTIHFSTPNPKGESMLRMSRSNLTVKPSPLQARKASGATRGNPVARGQESPGGCQLFLHRRSQRTRESISGEDLMTFALRTVNQVILESAKSFGICRVKPTEAAINGDSSRLPKPTAQAPRLLPVSAMNATSLQTRARDLSHYLQCRPESLDEVAHTLGSRRDHLLHRAFSIAKRDGKGIKVEFEGFQKCHAPAPGVVFIFTGQEAQWTGMGKELVDSWPSVRDDIRDMDRALQSLDEAPEWTIEGESESSGHGGPRR